MTRLRSGMRRTAIAGIAALCALVAVALAGTAAAAADSEILVSDDGVNFAADLPTGLFDGAGLLVPQDAVTRSLWIQNTSPNDGSLRLSVDDFDAAANAFNGSLTFSAVAGSDTIISTADELTKCSAVVPSLPIPAGGTVRVDITITVGNLSGVQGQADVVPLDFTAHVRDAASPFPSDPCAGPDGVGSGGDGGTDGGGDGGNGNGNGDGGNGDGNLSGTGVTYLPMVALSVALLGVGLVLVAARRRREDEARA